MPRAVPFAGCVMLLSVVASLAPAAQPGGARQRLNVEAVTTLDAEGGYIRLEGQSLFLTSDLQKDPRPGYWLDLSSDPRSPAQVCGSLPCGWDVALAGDYAFLCDYTNFLTVYDTRAGQWQQIAKLDMPSMTENILIRGKLAYVANHVAGLTIVDISTPSTPSILSNFNPQIDCDAIGLRNDCAILYGHWESRLVFVDISDPAKPRQIGVFQHDPKTFNQGELAVDGDFAYCTALTGLVIVNIADPANPKLAKSVDTQGRVTDVVVQDGYAFVAAGSGGVRVFDVHDPNQPEEVGYYMNGNQFAASQIAVQPAAGSNGYYLYVANNKGPATVLLFNAPRRNEDHH
ncbi:MAG: hypothetical protein GXX96_28570 [Planctomycetaceae bacterium]|nr:hypothetical protein [Planctomycetaceae bacterium]